MINLRPSSAYIWSNCAANPFLSEALPEEPPTDAAREGTCAAWVAECVLKGDASSAEDMLDASHVNGWTVTTDMVYYVQKYIDHVFSRGGQVSAELTVRICAFIQGTFDSSTVSATSSILYIDDLKFGMEIVEAFENPQTILYGAGEFMRLVQLGLAGNLTHACLGIYQPRAFHHEGIYRHYTVTIQELMNAAQELVNKGALCQEPNPIATPGPWCTYCRALRGCEAATHTMYKLEGFISRSSHYRELTEDELSAELKAIDLILKLAKARRSALEPQAEAITRKKGLRGFYMKPRVGNRKFKYSKEVIHAMTGVDPSVVDMCTPAELERRNVSPDLVNALSHQPPLPAKLEPMSDREMRKLFSKG